MNIQVRKPVGTKPYFDKLSQRPMPKRFSGPYADRHMGVVRIGEISRSSFGDVPFYTLPYINLRGIPFNRYQGSQVLQTELEAMYKFTDRWAVVPFAGVGATADALDEFGSSDPKFAGGLGFRYLIARKLRLASGVDIARGPEDWAIYFTVGSGL